MTEGQEFYLALVLLYVSECLLWLRPGEWAFLSGWPGGWKADPPRRVGGKRRIAVAMPLPPLGWGFETYGSRVDVAGVREVLAAFEKRTRWLRAWSAWFVMPWFFVVLPLSYRYHGAELPFFLHLAIGWVAMWVATGMFFLAHRRLHPKKRFDRWQHSLLSLLVPQHAIRSAGIAARPLLATFHPMAVAAAVLKPTPLREVLGRRWRALTFPAPGQAPDEAERAVLARIIGHAGLDADSLLAPPARGADAVAYCPCCFAMFRDATATCRECEGRGVVEFASTPETSA